MKRTGHLNLSLLFQNFLAPHHGIFRTKTVKRSSNVTTVKAEFNKVIKYKVSSICVSSESAVGIQEDRKKVPWSDKETIILLEIWGDPQVKDNTIMEILHFNYSVNFPEKS